MKNTKNFEFGIDSRYENQKDKNFESIRLMEERVKRLKNLPPEQVIKAKLLQLKYKMEDYLSKTMDDNQNHFTGFLELYIDSIYPKRIDFAKDINVTPNFLSKIINKHREPKDDFFHKLMIHSEKVYKNISDFHKTIWIEVYYHEKICETLANQKNWRPKIEKQIKISALV